MHAFAGFAREKPSRDKHERQRRIHLVGNQSRVVQLNEISGKLHAICLSAVNIGSMVLQQVIKEKIAGLGYFNRYKMVAMVGHLKYVQQANKDIINVRTSGP